MFAFRSQVACPVQAELADAEKSLARLSEKNPDGWGVAHYVGGTPQLVKSPTTAAGDIVYDTLARQLRSQTVVAHVRAATHGVRNVGNTQPYQFGRWVFAHNGNIEHFERLRPRLLGEIAPELRPYLYGDSDSEILFFLLLTAMRRAGLVSDERCSPAVNAPAVWAAVGPVLQRVARLVGGLSMADPPSRRGNYLTIVLTDGEMLLGAQGGKPLHVHAPTTEHHPENPSCPHEGQRADHFLLASEPVGDSSMWDALRPGEAIAVDEAMHLWRFDVSLPDEADLEGAPNE